MFFIFHNEWFINIIKRVGMSNIPSQSEYRTF